MYMTLVNEKAADTTKKVKNEKLEDKVRYPPAMPKEEWIQIMLKKYPSSTRKSLEYSLVKWS